MSKQLMNQGTGVRLAIETGDEEGFAAAKEWLLDGFEGWLPPVEAGLAGDAAIASTGCGGYGEGNLAHLAQ